MNNDFDFVLAQGGKLEFSTSQSGTYTEMVGFTAIPAESSGVEEIDTTCLANKKYKSKKLGLFDAPGYEWNLNLQDPTLATSNIVKASEMEDSDNYYYWKITYASGIVITYKAKVRTYLQEAPTGDIEKFTMIHDVDGEPKRQLPTLSA